ncbi:MAG: carboxypeptidase regulatory-like domain-containing protein [Vicinamibacterales bacterium]
MCSRASIWLLTAIVGIFPTPAIAQIGQTASLVGVVRDENGGVLPEVSLTASSPALIGGLRRTVSDSEGAYHFPSLAPGVYRLEGELAGFSSARLADIRLELGQTLVIDVRLEVAGLVESVTVSSAPPMVNPTSSAQPRNLSTEVMENMPFTSRFGPAAMLLAPGVNPNTFNAYGSGGQSSNAYQIDGVDLGDPYGGTIWVFANHNWIQEVQIIGLGAAAEYGGFSGVASNSLFRSGSNRYSGLIETLYENNWLTDSNVSAKILEANPDLTPGTTDYVTDTTAQLGGPFKRDRAWFFGSVQYYRPSTAPAGYPAAGTIEDGGPRTVLEKSPRFLFKPTVQLGGTGTLTGFVSADSYTVDGRGASAIVAPIATVRQYSPETSWNANYTKILSAQSVFDVKYSGFHGYYDLEPYNGLNTPGWYDVSDNFFSRNSYYYYSANRQRHQANAALSTYSSRFAGDHNFKFGAEFERSYTKNQQGYPGGRVIYADAGVPYGASYWEGYVKDDANTRTAFYVQDQWLLSSRVAIDAGLRVDVHLGADRTLGETVYRSHPVAPRLGVAYKLTADGKTVAKAHYGLYYDGAKASYYDLLSPRIAPYYYADLNPVTLAPISPLSITAPGGNRVMDEDIGHPRMIQAVAGFERELGRGWAAAVTGIYRKNDRFVDDVLVNGRFFTSQEADPGPDGIRGNSDDTGVTLTAYRQTDDPLNNEYLITNPPEAYRRYKAVELRVRRRESDGRMLDLSWVISRIKGTQDNFSSFGNGSEFDDPNQDVRFQPLRDGILGGDNTHVFKVLGGWRLPWQIRAAGIFYYTSGFTFARTLRLTLPQGRRDLFVEERGSQRLEGQPRLDVKLEKRFSLTGSTRLGVTLEGFNLLNNGAITSRITRSGSSYFRPTGLVPARRYRLGLVYRF